MTPYFSHQLTKLLNGMTSVPERKILTPYANQHDMPALVIAYSDALVELIDEFKHVCRMQH